jgi:diguanylate cyclase
VSVNDKYQAAKRYADIAQDMMSKNNVGPTPQNYAVFYLFANSSNKELNERINLRLKQNKELDDIFLETLFCEYISNTEQINQSVLQPLNNSISHLMDKINQQVSLDEETLSNLVKADKALNKSSQTGPLLQLVNYITGSMNRSKTQHRSLSKELSVAQLEMQDLKKQLDISRKEAISDALTGLLNRRGGDEKLKELNIEDVHTSLAIDIDHFKSVNDNFGHYIGDRVIQRVAKSIQENIAEKDLAIRAGGEEFLVVMAHKTTNEAKIVADKIRETISNLKLKQKNSNNFLPRISVSVGIAQNKNEEDWTDLFKRADEALYQAKNAGRDCSIIAQ